MCVPLKANTIRPAETLWEFLLLKGNNPREMEEAKKAANYIFENGRSIIHSYEDRYKKRHQGK